MTSPRSIPRAWLLAVPLTWILYFQGLTGAGLLGPDEPRYASVAREMARSGDWITPRLWGQPWFEKPALLYWMEAAAFRLGLGEDLAPRLPVALASVALLCGFFWMLRREFGEPAAWYATAILATSAGWLAMSHAGVTDLPMAAAFNAALLCCLRWVHKGERRELPAAAAFLGLAMLAKGLVPLVLALPLAWFGRRRILDLLRPQVSGTFVLVTAPWYALCYLRNGAVFPRTFFWEHHFGRFASDALQHPQPFWFYVPVIIGALFPWAPALALMGRKSFYADPRRAFLLAVVIFGLVFFSASANKLPGYVLPLLPAAAALLGLALAGATGPRAILAACAVCLVILPVAGPLLPDALAEGLSRAHFPSFEWTWLIPVALAAIVWRLERAMGVALLCVAVAAGVFWIQVRFFPALDAAASARPIWREIASRRDQVCVEQMHRSWRYGLNYYSVAPLPDCGQVPKPLRVKQVPGQPPELWGVTEPRP